MNGTTTPEGLAAALGQALRARRWTAATAESCTGGLVAAAITDVPGSSAWFDRGFVTYSNAAKQDLLGVPLRLIEEYGAVSEATARAMAEGAIMHSRADVAVSVTGVAGPDGGTATKPVGMVCFGFLRRGERSATRTCHLPGDRGGVRRASVALALEGLIQLAGR